MTMPDDGGWDPNEPEPDHILDAQAAEHAATDRPPTRRGHLTAVPNHPTPPPHDTNAETALLGAALLSTTARDALATLDPADFYTPTHSVIARTINTLHAAGEPVDPITVNDALQATGEAHHIGDPTLLLDLQAATPATSNATSYARIIRNHATRRHLQLLGAALTTAAADPTADLDQTTTDTQATLDQLTERSLEQAAYITRTGDLVDEYFDDLEHRATHGTDGIPTGWDNLDRLTHGLAPQALTTIAARPGMGKSDVAAALARHVASTGTPVLYCSLEMSRTELMHRWVAATARITATALTTGQLDDWSWGQIPGALATLSDLPLHIDDNPAATIATIRASAKRTGARLIIIDYLQLIDGPKAESRQIQVSSIAGGLKRLARQLDIPVVALAQLNRGLEARGDKRPILSDLRESGAIEQDSDVVIGLYRDDIYHDDSRDKGVLELGVIKNRAGATGKARMAYDPARKSITAIADQGDR